jgi:hypothetical protein
MYAFVIGRCNVSGVQTIERRKLTSPNWSLYQDNVQCRRDKAERDKSITQGVNQSQNA